MLERRVIPFFAGFALVVVVWRVLESAQQPSVHHPNLQRLHLRTHQSVAVNENGAPIVIDPLTDRRLRRHARNNVTIPVRSAASRGRSGAAPSLGRSGRRFEWYQCFDENEAYAGAFVASKATFMKNRVHAERLLAKNVNMEGASFSQMQGSSKLKTVDHLDFYSIHLSWFERRLWDEQSASNVTLKVAVQDDVISSMVNRTGAIRGEGSHHPTRARHDRVLAVMPFFASSGGALGKSDAGHSALEMRRAYLSFTFWTLYDMFPHIVLSVASREDHDFARSAGLPWFDIMVNEIPRADSLGIATIMSTQQRLERADWGRRFDYVFYTESDQILHARDLGPVFAAADRKNTLALPHRTVPVPLAADFRPSTLEKVMQTPIAETLKKHGRMAHVRLDAAGSLSRTRCCYDRGECKSRDHWVPFAEATLISAGSTFAFLGGEGNFLRDRYRPCALFNGEACPS